MFWRRNRFSCAARRDINFQKVFAAMQSPLAGAGASGGANDVAAALLPMLEASPHLMESLQRVGTIAQMVVLQPVKPADAADGAGGSLPALRTVTHKHAWATGGHADRLLRDCSTTVGPVRCCRPAEC